MNRDVTVGDLIAEWIGAGALGFAGAFAGYLVGAVPASAAASLLGTLGGLAIMRRIGERANAPFAFETAAFESADEEPLLLDDRLDPPSEDSRVVQLFAPTAIDPPGALAERIDHWLADQGRRTAHAPGHGPQSSPASAALHSALADLKRSLG